MLKLSNFFCLLLLYNTIIMPANSELSENNNNYLAKFIPILSGLILAELHHYVDGGKFESDSQKQAEGKTTIAETVYSEIFTIQTIGKLLGELYTQEIVSLYEKKYGKLALAKGDTFFGEGLFNESLGIAFSIRPALGTLRDSSESMKKMSKSFFSLTVIFGIIKAILEHKMHDKIKEKLEEKDFFKNHSLLSNLSTEVIKTFSSTYIMNVIYNCLIAAITIFKKENKETKHEIEEKLYKLLKTKSYNAFTEYHESIEKSDIGLTSAIGYEFGKIGISGYKIFNYFL